MALIAPTSPDEGVVETASPIVREIESPITEPQDIRLRQLPSPFDNFANALIEEFEEIRRFSGSRREASPRNFKDRLDRSRRRARNEHEVVYSSGYGEVKTGAKDGHVKMGMGLGWSMQAIRLAAEYFAQNMFETGDRSFQVRTLGNRPDNPTLKTAVTAAVDEVFRRASFEEIGKRRGFLSGRDGTGILRYYPISKLHFTRDEQGRFIERRGEPEAHMEMWPIEDVFFTNPERPSAWDQENWFWVTRNATVHSIDCNEATYSIMPTDTPTGLKMLRRKDGRFFNLARLRGMSSSVEREPAGFDIASSVQSDRANALSSHPRFDLIEVEGMLPSKMIDWVLDGTFTWEMAMALGIDVGVGPPMTDDDKIEFAERLLRIDYWQISYKLDSSDSKGGVLLEFDVSSQYDPMSSVRRRNSAYVYKYGEDGDELLGLSVTSLGYRIEDVADCLVNSDLWIAYFNANPSSLGDKSKLIRADKESVVNLLVPGKHVEYKPGQGEPSPDSVMQFMQLHVVPGIYERLSVLGYNFEVATGVLAAAKSGATGEETLGQTQINQSTSRVRLDGVIISHAKEDQRLIKAILMDQYHARGRTGFINWIARVGGEDSANLDRDIDSYDGIWEQIEIDHPISFVRDRQVAAQRISDAASIPQWAQAMDPVKSLKAYFTLSGVQHASEFMLSMGPPISPQEKHRQLAQGNTVELPPGLPPQDIVMHIAADRAMVQTIVNGQTPPEFQGVSEQLLLDGLQRLLPVEEQLLQLSMQMQAAMMQQQGGGGMPQGPSSDLDESNGISQRANNDPAAARSQTEGPR